MTKNLNIRSLYFGRIGLTSTKPMAFEVSKAEGIHIFDQKGEKYIDLISGISVSSLGHNNPAVVKAVCDQAGKYMHTMVYGEHIQHPQVAFANLLVNNLPRPFDNVYFVNSGTEAVEGAMKLVKKLTGRYEIIACKNAYHGSTHGSQSLMDSEYFSAPYRPFLPGIKFVQYGLLEDLIKITEKTAEVLTPDGWFHTGDIGEMVGKNKDFLKITDRKKEMFKTSGGKYVAPQLIENMLKESRFIEQAMIIGENRKHPSVLVVPSFEFLKEWALRHGVTYTSDAEIIKDQKVIDRIFKDIARITANLGKWEIPKKMILCPKVWSVENGELTPTLKLRRKNILAEFSEEIEALYA